jgi:hypothetical protein
MCHDGENPVAHFKVRIEILVSALPEDDAAQVVIDHLNRLHHQSGEETFADRQWSEE